MTRTDGAAGRPIAAVARDLDIALEYVEPYGRDKAKIRLEAVAASGRKPGKLILVSAITPTPAGEGKTTTSIGLSQGLLRIGKRVARQPGRAPGHVNVHAVLNSLPAPPASAMRPRRSCWCDSGS